MSEAVIDDLEVIEVQKEDGHQRTLPPRAGQRMAQTLHKQRTIREPGQRIVECLMGQLLVKSFALAYIPAGRRYNLHARHGGQAGSDCFKRAPVSASLAAARRAQPQLGGQALAGRCQ